MTWPSCRINVKIDLGFGEGKPAMTKRQLDTTSI